MNNVKEVDVDYRIIISNDHIGYLRKTSRGDVVGQRTLEGKEITSDCDSHELLEVFAGCIKVAQEKKEEKAHDSESKDLWTVRVYRAGNFSTPILGYQFGKNGMYLMNAQAENLTDQERKLFEKYTQQSEHSKS